MAKSFAPAEIAVFKDVMVPMRDGVRLATDIYFPSNGGEIAPGPFGTILCRTSYNKDSQRYVEPVGYYFARNGFVAVVQDVRGRHHSEGIGQYFHVANEHEGRDGYDTIEWIASQPWSNGKVGMVGSSHVGLVQTHAALYSPPHLTAIWPDVIPTKSYWHQSRKGGAMQLQMFGALFVHAHDAPEIADNPEAQCTIIEAMKRMRELVYQTPFRLGETPLSVVPNLEKTLIDYYTRGAYDEYWAAEYNDFTRHFDRHADIPITFTGGWFDLFADATTTYYAEMAAKKTSKMRLIMGPWMHTSMRSGVSFAGDVDFGPDSVWGQGYLGEQQVRWYNRWLKGEQNGVEDDPPVQIFVMGGGSGRRNAEGRLDHGGAWRIEQEWPIARTQYTTFYFQPNQGLAQHLPPADAAPLSYDYDPNHPVPTISASLSGLMEVIPLSDNLDEYWAQNLPLWVRMRSIIVEGGSHQKEDPSVLGSRPPYPLLADRPDVLIFDTEPLAEDVEITGPITVHLFISSSAPDTDFTAKLVDVYPPNEDYPDGYHLGLTDSIIRVRYRESFEREVLMEPGKVYEVTIEMAPTSNLFKRGHRIRIEVSSSNFPRFDLNPNTGEPIGRHTHYEVAHNTVYIDRDRASYVVLPIVPPAS